ncbi:MAG: hypothetical protein ISS72_05915 [Candidatus Brocadiae bacterium]|nr:hypothetical protein [Candidatus Brocadiia bacterium]
MRRTGLTPIRHIGCFLRASSRVTARGAALVEYVVLALGLALAGLVAFGFVSFVFAPMGQGIGDTLSPMFP